MSRSYRWLMSIWIALASAQAVHAQGTPQVSASPGQGFICSLSAAGAVKCWGNASNNLLGGSDALVPTAIPGLASHVASIASGFQHACAAMNDGTAKCWGYGGSGQLGDGVVRTSANGYSYTPVTVSGLTGVNRLSTNDVTTCAVTGGAVKCWGQDNGLIVDSATAFQYAPVGAGGLGSGIAAIAVGASHMCALTSAGGVECRGSNINGQLGNGGQGSSSSTPVNVTGLGSGVTALSAYGGRTCAILTGGTVKCWGLAPLGDGTSNNSSTPVDVAGLSGVMSVSVALDYNCAVISGGAVKCWGYNGYGQLGNGDTTHATQLTPVSVVGLSHAASVSAGEFSACAMSTAGVLSCWGSAALGDGTNNGSPTPITISYDGGGNANVALTLISSTNPSVVGRNVTFTASIGGGNAPGGNVSFNDGSTVLCANVVLVSGSAACATTALSVGTHSITAIYSGDANNAGTTSAPLPQVVNLAPAAVTLNLAPNPATVNQNVTASVQIGGLVPDGSAGPVNIATAGNANPGVAGNAYAAAFSIPVSGGGQSCTAALTAVGTGNYSGSCMLSFPAPGSYAITANYAGSSTNAPSSASQNLTVNAVVANTPGVAAPALSTWMLALLGALLAASAWKRRHPS